MDSDQTVTVDYKTYPLIPLRGACVFPGMRLAFEVGRPDSLAALNAAMESDQMAFLTAQMDSTADEIKNESELQRIGALCRIQQVMRVPGEEIARVMAEGVSRAALIRITRRKPYCTAVINPFDTPYDSRTAVKAEALIRQCYGLLEEYAQTLGLDTKEAMS